MTDNDVGNNLHVLCNKLAAISVVLVVRNGIVVPVLGRIMLRRSLFCIGPSDGGSLSVLLTLTSREDLRLRP